MSYVAWEHVPARLPKLYADDSVRVVFRLVESELPHGQGARCVRRELETGTMQGAVDLWYRLKPNFHWTIAEAIRELTGYWAGRDLSCLQYTRGGRRLVALSGGNAIPAPYLGHRGPYHYDRDVLAKYFALVGRCAVCRSRIDAGYQCRYTGRDAYERRRPACWFPPRNLTPDETRTWRRLHDDNAHQTCSPQCHRAAMRALRTEMWAIRDERLSIEKMGSEVRELRRAIGRQKPVSNNPAPRRLETWTSMKSRLGKLRSLASTLPQSS